MLNLHVVNNILYKKNHNVGGIEFKNVKWSIESPARFLYDLMC